MPGGLNLGGAFFTIYGDNEQLLRTMAQARAATDTATKAMGNAQKAYATAAASSNAAVIRMNVEVAEQWVRTAQVASGAVRDNVAVLKAYGTEVAKAGTAASGAAGGVNKLTEAQRKAKQAADEAAKATAQQTAALGKIGSTLATLTGFGAIASGALLAREAILAFVDAAQKLNQEQFRLRKQFGDMAPALEKQAAALAQLSGRSYADAIAATNTFATVQKQYGVSTAQLADLQVRAADAAAVTGVSLEEAAKRIAPALRGEAESIEFLGFSLQSDYLKALQDVTSAEYKRWQQMGPLEKTQQILIEFQKQSNEQAGAAAERANGAAGAYDKMAAAAGNLAGALGQGLNPALVATANLFATISNHLATSARNTAEYKAAIDQLMAEKQVPEWLRFLIGQTSYTGKGNPLVESVVAANRALEEQQDAFARAALAAKQQRDIEQEQRNNQIKFLHDAGKKALDDQIDAENTAYEGARARHQADRDAKLDAVEAKRDSALAGIAAEKQAAEDLYEVQLAALQKQKEAALQAAEDRHTAAVRALDVEKDAVQQASELQQRGLKERAEGEERASQDRLRDTKAALEAEDRIRDAARVEEDRALEDQTSRIKQELDDRHEDVVEAIEAEARAVREGAEQDLRRVENQSKAADRRHQKKLRQLDEAHDKAEKNAAAAARALDQEAQAAERARDASVRAIEAEVDAAEERHRLAVGAIDAEKDAAEERQRTTLVAIEAERDAAEERHRLIAVGIEAEGAAAEARHDAIIDRIEAEVAAAEEAHRRAVGAIDAEKDAAEAAHAGTIRAIEAEGEAAERSHDGIVGAIKAEEDAAEARHRSVVRGFDDELDAAEALHDRQREAIEDLKRAEDDRHDARLRQIKEEQDRREAFIDAQLGALDEAERREAGADTLAGLQDELRKALSGGNQAEIAEAQRAILREQNQQQRDALREQLRARQDAVKAAAELAKDAADLEHEQAERSISDAREVADARLDAIKASVAARKQAADDELARIKAGLDARKQAADDELARIKAILDGRKQAADDELVRIKAILDGRKQAADEALRLVKEGADARKAAADEELARIKAELDARKASADEALRLVKEQLDARKDAADEELRTVKEVLDARKVAADEALRLIKADADARKVAAADELQRIKDELAAKKLALDDEKAKRQEVHDDAKTKLADQEQREKDALDKKKIRIQDERDAALLALQAKREKEEDDNEELERREGAALTETKRKIQDRRTAEDLAATDARKAAEETARLEQLGIKDTLDAAVLASKDALDAYTRDYGQRKLVVDAQYTNEKDQIHATFDDPETGLIPKLKAAYEDTKEWYDRRTTEVNNQYKNEKDQIEDTFNHAEHGLFARLKAVHDATVKGLEKTREDWEKGFAEPILDVAGKTFAEIQKMFDELREKNKLAAIGPVYGPPVPPGWKPGDDGGGGKGGRVAGGGYRPVVDDATDNSYWTSGGTHGGHPAADIFAPRGSAIHAPVGGTSSPARYSKGGNATILRGDDGRWYYMAHGNDAFEGGRVEAGEVIGHVGTTGNAEGTSPHLHLGIASDPDLFDRWNGSGDLSGDDSYWTGEGGDRGGTTGPPAGSTGIAIRGDYLVFTLFGQRYRIKLPTRRGKGPVGSKNASEEEVESFIADAAKQREIDPEAALAVVDGEGGLEPMAVGKFKTGWSFWPLQLHYGGKGYEQYGDTAGMGTPFTKETGWQPGDPTAWKASTEYGLDEAKKYGWGQWYGRKKHGIGEWEGIARYRNGGPIPEPTLLVGRTLGPYAMAGEVAPEWVTPNAPAGGNNGPLQRAEMPIILGNREVERIWITGYRLNAQRGRAMLPAHRRIT